MLLSMTGFANSNIEVSVPNNDEKLVLSVNIKSLNSRFFEASCKLPSVLNKIEIPLTKQLKTKLHRGRVFLQIKISNPEILQTDISPSLNTIENYLQAIHTIQSKFNINDQVTLSQILQLPNTLQSEEVQISEKVEAEIIKKIEHLTDTLVATQKKEGAALSKDIKEQMSSMKKTITSIKKRSQEIIKEKKSELDEIMISIEKLTPQEEGAPSSHEQCLLDAKKTSLIHQLEKIDINEEIVRFNSHLKSITTQLASKEVTKGKRLDFTIQELNREINTIASKCSDAKISSFSIDVKTDLEKAREQVQNII